MLGAWRSRLASGRPNYGRPVLSARPPHRRRALLLAAALAALVATTTATPSTTAAPTASPSATAPAHAGPVSTWSTAAGTDQRVYLADGQGRALQLHGFNIKSGEPATAASEELLALAAAHGMDHVRLAWFWQDLEPTEDAYDDTYLAELVTVLDRAEALGLKVILDMHQDVFGEAFQSRGVPAWATRTDGLAFEKQDSWLLDYLQPAVQAAFDHLYEDADLRQAQIDAWLHVVQEVKDHPALLGYDLLNEPFGQLRDGESLFEAAARVERTQLTPMYQRLTDAIAAVDADHWVFVEPPNLASLGIATSLGEVNGPKVAVYPHMYDANIELATYGDDGKIVYDPGFFSSWADAIRGYAAANRIPMLVGEWGVAHPERPGMDAFVADSLATLDAEASGWSMFTMCRGEGYCPFDAAGNPRPAIGAIFAPYARAIAGAPTSTTFDPEARSLRVRFDESEATGPTEIWLDADGTYPDGWKVQTSDPDGTWTSSYDEATGVLAVDLSATGEPHAICVVPADAPDGCTATDPEPIPPAGDAPPAAVPVAARPDYTG